MPLMSPKYQQVHAPRREVGQDDASLALGRRDTLTGKFPGTICNCSGASSRGLPHLTTLPNDEGHKFNPPIDGLHNLRKGLKGIARSADPRFWGPRFLRRECHKSQRRRPVREFRSANPRKTKSQRQAPALGIGSANPRKSRGPQRRRSALQKPAFEFGSENLTKNRPDASGRYPSRLQ